MRDVSAMTLGMLEAELKERQEQRGWSTSQRFMPSTMGDARTGEIISEMERRAVSSQNQTEVKP